MNEEEYHGFLGYWRQFPDFPEFFILMVLWGVIAPQFNIETIGYPMAMLITITIWLVIAPLAAAGAGRHH